jgi:hypothetical protein
MKRGIALILALILVFFVVGCGGGGGGGNENGSPINVVGTWTGNIVVTTPAPGYTVPTILNVTGQSNGTFSGTANVNATGNAAVSGTINSSGSSLTFTFTRNGLIATGTGSVNGNTMSGIFTNTAGESGTFSFTKNGGSSGDAININLINTLLDTEETATISMDVDTMVSLRTYPFNSNGYVFNNAEALRDELESFFDELLRYNSFRITNRVITVNGNSATVNCTRYLRYTYKDGEVDEDTGSWVLNLKKISGIWKFSSTIEMSSNSAGSASSRMKDASKGFWNK